jgi:hypothetical protein
VIDLNNLISLSQESDFFLDSDSSDMPFTQLDIIPHNNCCYASLEENLQSEKFLSSFSILHINCRSLNKNFDKLQNFLSNLAFQPAIITLSETWLKPSNPISFFSITDYSLISNPRKTKKRGGGVAIYILKSLEFSILINVDTPFLDICDSCAIEIYSKVGPNIIISTIYKPPDTNVTCFNTALSQYLENINIKNKLFFLTGDFNIDLLSYHSRNATTDFVNLLMSHGFLPSITLPTRITQKSSTLLDNIFINNINHDFQTFIIFDDLSDHLPILLNYNIKSKLRKESPVLNMSLDVSPNIISLRFKELSSLLIGFR